MKPTRVKTLHFRIDNISRRTNGNAVAACAYQSRQDLYDQQKQKPHTYERRGDVLGRGIFAPDNAPDWMRDDNQQRLWERFGNEIEKAEDAHNRRATALLAKSFIVAAPRELSNEQNWKLAGAMAKRFNARGLAAGVAMHEEDASDGGKNPHFHFIVPPRTVNEEGFSKRKFRGLDAPGRGENPELGQLRREYYALVNDALAEAGVEGVYYDPEKQEDKEPGQHVGKKAHATKGPARDKAEEIRERNRAIALDNHMQAHMRRIGSPAARQKEEEYQDTRRARGSSMAARDLAQRDTQLDKTRGRKTLDIAIDRAAHVETWQQRIEREREAQKQRERVPDL